VLSKRFFEGTSCRAVLSTKNAPVPYVLSTSPAAKQACPTSAACWSPATPQMRKDWPKLKIMGWDHNKYTRNSGDSDRIMTEWVQTLYEDPEAAKHVDGVAFHWYQQFEGFGFEFEALNVSHHLSPPGKFLLNTEACDCGTPQPFNWKNGERYGIDIIGDLNNWSTGWVDWNLILNEEGGPNHVHGFCEAPFIFDRRNGSLYTLPKFYYMGHISKFILPAHNVVSTTVSPPTAAGKEWDAVTAVASVSPNNADTTVVVVNPTDRAVSFKIHDMQGKRALRASIPAHGIQTYVWSASD